MPVKALSFICTLFVLCLSAYSLPAHAEPDCGHARNQKEMNSCASRAYKNADKKLNKGYNKSLEKIKSRELYENFRDAQRAWIKYRDLNCDFAADTYKGGSLEPFIYYDCMERLTSDRYEEISDLFSGNDR